MNSSFIMKKIQTNNGTEVFLFTEDYKKVIHKDFFGRTTDVSKDYMIDFIKNNSINNDVEEIDEDANFDWDTWVSVG